MSNNVRKKFLQESMNQLDSRLSNQPQWVQEIVNSLTNENSVLQKHLDQCMRTSDDCDGDVYRGYPNSPDYEKLPTHGVYSFRVGENNWDIISVYKRVDEPNKLYINCNARVLKIQPCAYNACYFTVE